MVGSQQQQWMRQWRRAARALAAVRRQSLAQMSEAEALAAAERVLASGVPGSTDRPASISGLVDQQRLLHQRRP